jgi:hypothetical protein
MCVVRDLHPTASVLPSSAPFKSLLDGLSAYRTPDEKAQRRGGDERLGRMGSRKLLQFVGDIAHVVLLKIGGCLIHFVRGGRGDALGRLPTGQLLLFLAHGISNVAEAIRRSLALNVGLLLSAVHHLLTLSLGGISRLLSLLLGRLLAACFPHWRIHLVTPRSLLHGS